MLRIFFALLIALSATASAQPDAPIVNEETTISETVTVPEPRRLDIVFINPSNQEDAFWTDFQDFMQAAADDLNINLEVMYSDREAVIMLDNLRKIVARPVRPDAVIFQNLKKNGLEALEIANAANIPAFLVNAGVDYAEAGLPRRQFSNWLGELIPDDEVAGYTLANLLVDTARFSGLTDSDGNVNILAFSGTASDKASEDRVRGLKRAVEEMDNVNLLQIVSANWRQDTSAEKFYWLHARYPDIHVVWTASDGMALGTIDTARELDILNEESSSRYIELLVGGVDWISPARQSIEEGNLLLSMGGHFMDGAWSLVLLRDYFDGIDFADDTTQQRSYHSVLNSTNISDYQEYLGNSNDWDAIDFSAFSKSYSPQRQNYNFSLNAVLQQLVNQKEAQEEIR